MKVFLVVGTMFPFDRLVKEIDQWAGTREDIQVTGQIGFGKYKPGNFEAYAMLDAKDFNSVFDSSELVVTHAGAGIILKSLVACKPIIVLPRKLELHEHNTDHQMATARALDKMGYVQIAWDNGELRKYLENPEMIESKMKLGAFAPELLINNLKEFIRSQ